MLGYIQGLLTLVLLSLLFMMAVMKIADRAGKGHSDPSLGRAKTPMRPDGPAPDEPAPDGSGRA